MCKECVTKLSRAFSFRKQCREADEYLRAEVLKYDILDVSNIKTDEFIEVPDNFKVEILNDLDYDENVKCEESQNISLNDIETDYKTEYLDPAFTDEIINNDDSQITIDECIDKPTEIISEEFSNINFDVIDETILKDCEVISNDYTTIKTVKNVSIIQKTKKQRNRKPPTNNQWLCSDCGKIFKSYYSYMYHIAKEHKPGEWYKRKKLSDKGNFDCEHCDRKFTSKQLYKRHIKLHDPDNPNICETCGKLCSDKHTLASHMVCHQEKTLKCDVCGKLVDTVSNLEKHMRFHTGERPYKCSYCDERFITSSNVRSHERSHLNKIYTCSECNKVYKSDRTFKKHLRTHNPNVFYDCEYCKQRFKTTLDRNKHLYTHPEFKPFDCPYCSKSMISANALDIHVRMNQCINKRKRKA